MLVGQRLGWEIRSLRALGVLAQEGNFSIGPDWRQKNRRMRLIPDEEFLRTKGRDLETS